MFILKGSCRSIIEAQFVEDWPVVCAQQSVLWEVSGMTFHCSGPASVMDDGKELWPPPQDASGHKSPALLPADIPNIIQAYYLDISYLLQKTQSRSQLR